MAFKSLVPWRRDREEVPVRRVEDDLPALRTMDRIFDNFFRGFALSPLFNRMEEGWSAYMPSVDLAEDEKEIRVSAELPGMDEKDVEVSVSRDILTIKGEKRQEKEEKEQSFYRMERSYGAFERQIQLPVDIDKEGVKATFRKGVLEVVLPKTPEAQQAFKKIPVKAEA